MKRQQHHWRREPQQRRPIENRRGAILPLAAIMLIVVFAFTAFTVDIGSITLTKSQLRNASDAAAHAATLELRRAFGPGAEISNEQAEDLARATAIDMINRHRSGDLVSTPADLFRDVRLGHYYYDESTGQWVQDWGVGPYNMAEVSARRIRDDGSQLPLTFAGLIGHEDAEVQATGVKAAFPAGGFTIPPGTTGSTGGHNCGLLPFTVDLTTWNNLLEAYYDEYAMSNPGNQNLLFADTYRSPGASPLQRSLSHPQVFALFATLAYPPGGNGNGNGGGSVSMNPTFEDNYRYDPLSGQVTLGQDGIPELNMYPDLNSSLPPGNRGMVDLGSPNNSTSDVKRQILYGLNEFDFSFFPNNTISVDPGPLYLNGDTGISAGMKDELAAIIGQPRAIPIFIEVSGNGNNANYTIVKFVGIRVMDVKLSGGPTRRYVYIQPAPYSCEHAIRSNGPILADSILTRPVTIQ